jgi:hypothetical protein
MNDVPEVALRTIEDMFGASCGTRMAKRMPGCYSPPCSQRTLHRSSR